MKKVDISNQTCTEMKTNRRVIFPPGRCSKEEATIEVRNRLWNDIVEKYMVDNCKEDGSQKTSQLSKAQDRGRMKLLKRVRSGEIHISPADKGSSIVVMPLQMYFDMVETHTRKDLEVTWRTLGLAQKLVRSQARSLAKIFRLGASRGERNQSRCHDNSSSCYPT